MVFIVIPVFNRIAYTVNCLKSLQNQGAVNYKIIVVDHGSTDGTSTFIEENFPGIILLLGEESMWWAAATNVGVRYALSCGADYVLTLNNDLIVGKHYLKSLLWVAGTNPKAIVGSISVDITDHQRVVFAGTDYSPWHAGYRDKVDLSLGYDELKKRQKTIGSDLLPGRGTLIPVEVFHHLGLFDEKSFPHYAADEDLSLRAKRKGYPLMVSTASVVYSHVQQTGLVRERFSVDYALKVFTSVRSPKNLKIRWRWALKHSKTPAPLYFAIDFSRLVMGMLFKSSTSQ